jgi:hypothetical protein
VRPDPSCPIDLGDLTYGEHLIVWAFRVFARGRDCVIVRREFDYVCGDRAAEAFGAMRVFVQHLAALGRRPIVLPPPGSPVLARDEQRVLCLFAAAQAGDSARFAAQFRELAGAVYDPVVQKAAVLVVEAMAQRGHRLRSFGPVEPFADTELVAPALSAVA